MRPRTPTVKARGSDPIVACPSCLVVPQDAPSTTSKHPPGANSRPRASALTPARAAARQAVESVVPDTMLSGKAAQKPTHYDGFTYVDRGHLG